MNFTRKSIKGFTLVEIMIVVAIIGILMAIAVPGFVRARTQSRMRACQENLQKIDGAVEQWALETNAALAATVDSGVLAPSDGSGILKTWPSCPGSGTAYASPQTVGTLPTCPTSIAGHVLVPTSGS